MERQVRHCTTEDGVSIAYTVVGEDVPVVFSFPIFHLIYTWESPVWRSWLESMAGLFRFNAHDARDSS